MYKKTCLSAVGFVNYLKTYQMGVREMEKVMEVALRGRTRGERKRKQGQEGGIEQGLMLSQLECSILLVQIYAWLYGCTSSAVAIMVYIWDTVVQQSFV